MANKPSIAAPWEIVDGRTISQWTAIWLNNVMKAPASDPLTDPISHAKVDGAQDAHGGPMAFLYGGPFTGSGTPEVHIKAGQDVLVPLINEIDVESNAPPDLVNNAKYPQDNEYSTIPNWHEKTHLGYAAEAKYVSSVGSLHVDNAYLTVAKASDPTHPILNLKWPLSELFVADSGVNSLGTVNGSNYLGKAAQLSAGQALDFPWADVAGRWAVLKDLPKGDYIVNYGGSLKPIIDPFDSTHVIAGGLNGGDLTTDSTIHLIVGH